jgi:hypothetical protein
VRGPRKRKVEIKNQEVENEGEGLRAEEDGAMTYHYESSSFFVHDRCGDLVLPSDWLREQSNDCDLAEH